MQRMHLSRLIALVIGAAMQAGCSGLWGAGAAAAGTAAAYEAHNKYEMDTLNRDYENGKMTKEEYEVRKSEVKRGSVIY